MTSLSYKYFVSLSCLYPFFSIIALRRRKASSAAKTRTSEADQNVEKLRKSTMLPVVVVVVLLVSERV